MANEKSRPEMYLAGVDVARIAYSPKPDTLASIDRREWPVYSLAEVSYFLEIPKPTLHSWTRQRTNAKGETREPLIAIASPSEALFSFYNLIEAHLLSVTTKIYGVRVSAIRRAINELREQGMATGIHPLLSREFYTNGKDLFIKLIEHTVNLSRSGQLALKPIMDEFIMRIERDEAFMPKKFYPSKQAKIIAMIPAVSSGRPIIDGTGIPVATIWNRFRSGDSIPFLANDYDIAETQVKGAIDYIEQLKAA